MDKRTQERLAAFLEKGGQRFETMEARLRRLEESNRSRLAGGAGAATPPEERKISFGKIVAGMARGGLDREDAWKGAEKEREIGLDARKRALEQGTDSAGGFVVPNQYVAELIPELVSKTCVLESGASPLNGTGVPIEIPRLAGGATASWNTENTTITDSDQTFDEVTLTPHMGNAMTKMSRRVSAMSNPSIEGIVRNDLVGAIARLLDIAALRGTGVGNVPLGIANIVTPTSLGATPTVDDLWDAVYALEAADSPLNRVGWIMHPRSFNTLRKVRSDSGAGAGTGDYLIQPDPTGASKGMLCGYPVRTTTAIPINLGAGVNESEIYLGDWAELIWGLFGSLIIEATTEGGDAFADHQVWVKVVTEVDFAPRHDESFVVLDQVLA